MPHGFRNRRSSRPRKQPFTVERLEARQMLAADLVISEFLAINDGVAFDEDGDTSDWIEIHNPTSQKVSLSGWSLTDEATDLDKWGFPNEAIAAGEYLIVFASQKDRSLAGAELHTNFKLDGDGEYLALVAPGDEIASEFSPAFPKQREDVSFGTGQLVEVTTLVGSGAPLKAWVPSDDSLGNTWTGGQALDDSAWKSGTAAVGFETQGISANESTPLAYWRFDASENGGAITPDAMGNYDATVSSAQLTSGGEGRFGEAYFFDGANDYISAGVIPELVTPGAMSISLWFKREAETSSATNHNVNNVLVAHSANATNDNFEIGTQGGNIEVYLDTTGLDGPNPSITQSAGIQNGVWHHVAITYDRNRVNEVQLYRDGQLVFESSQWGGALDTSASSPLTFGLARIDNQLWGDFNGWMDEVAVWDTALTTEQVVALSEGVSPLNLFGYTSLIGLDLEQEMLEDAVPPQNTAYVRIPFEVADPAEFDLLTLQMQYDDGFVAYLNGQQVAVGNAPQNVLWNSAALADRDDLAAITPQEFNLTGHLDLLHPGTNILAIQGLNFDATDTDFLIEAKLSAIDVSVTDEGFFTTPTPGEVNNDTIAGFVEEVDFGDERGFYDETFELILSTETAGAVVRYTTDFSVPTETTGIIYDEPIQISTTTALRATAFLPGHQPSEVISHTYIFLAAVLAQPANPAGFPSTWGSAGTADYAIDPNIALNTNSADYDPRVRDALLTHPTISLVIDNADFFGPAGLQSNPQGEGIAWERFTSVEIIDPNGGPEIQLNAGLRMQGNASRSTNRPKHNMRLLFKGIYGAKKLKFPLFEDSSVEKFDTIILRGGNGDSWFHPSASQQIRAQYIRDQWHRDTALAMGVVQPHQRYMHLYINGLYWGLYHIFEKPTASFHVQHLGGEKEDWDVLQHKNGTVDGNRDAWNEMMVIARAGLASDDAVGRLEQYIAVTELADYMLINLFSGNFDWDQNNWFGGRNRNDPQSQFRFYTWDAERSFWNLNENRTGVNNSNQPSEIHQRLTANAEYKLMFADRVHKYFFNDGLLSEKGAADRWQKFADEIELPLVAESARWGDNKRPGNPYTVEGEWRTELNFFINTYFPARTGIVLAQLESRGLYPRTDAPEMTINGLRQHGGDADAGDRLSFDNPNGAGTVYYTTGGSDPRLPGGAISPLAVTFDGAAIALAESLHVSARVQSASGEWSALSEASFLIGTPTLTISELQYHPADWPQGMVGDRDDFEFIEVFNYGVVPVELAGVRLTNGVDFDFSDSIVGSLAPGQYGVVVRDLTAFSTRYDTIGMTIIGEYLSSGDQLSNSGEKIELVDAFDQTINEFRFKDGWHKLTDGEGFSLTQINPSNADADLSNSAAWRPSSELHGSPGRADSLAAPAPGAIVVNEVLAHSDGGDVGGGGDWIELLNTTNADINIGGWFISNDRLSPLKYEIPLGTTLPAGGLATFTESQHFGASFTLSESGDEVVVQAAAGGAPLGFRAREDFDASENGRTFGRFIKTTGGKDFVAMENATFGAANSAPLVGPVVIHELMYNPGPNNGSEFIELLNITDAPVSLAGWHFSAISFTFADDVMIQPGELVVVVPLTPDDFRASHSVPAGARLFGPYLGSLNNAGESLRLNKPGQPDGETIPSIMVDRVSYDDKAPWPVEADGTGVALQRKQVDGYSNEPTNWTITLPGGTPGDFAIPPTVVEVFVSGSDWSAAMLDRLGGSGFSIPAGNAQLQILAWTGLDQISIRFSETVEVTIGDLRVAGVNVGDYDVADFNYDDATVTATWRLGQSIRADKLLIELSGSVSDGVRDESGLPLDGNWTNATSMFPSGNGVIDADSDADDAFRFRINVVAGDVTGDGQVDRDDLIDLIHALGDRGESRRRDLTGDGRVDVTDLRAALLRMGGGLPNAEP